MSAEIVVRAVCKTADGLSFWLYLPDLPAPAGMSAVWSVTGKHELKTELLVLKRSNSINPNSTIALSLADRYQTEYGIKVTLLQRGTKKSIYGKRIKK